VSRSLDFKHGDELAWCEADLRMVEEPRMASTFTWLDTSEHDRRRAMEVIDLFPRQNTQDELGVGTVRDSIAELLAPVLGRALQVADPAVLRVPGSVPLLARSVLSRRGSRQSGPQGPGAMWSDAGR